MKSTKNMSELEQEAWKIGVHEAHTQKKIVPACRSKKMMEFIKNHSKKIGDSIPWLDAYNYGVAYEINIQAVFELG